MNRNNPLKRRARRLVCACLMLSMGSLSLPAHANLNEALSGMFTAVNTTSAGSISSQIRGGMTGGAVTARTPIVAANIIAFDPPRVNAGCGGIDLYAGSFSFINKEQLIALMRAIASNAAGLLFKAAIQAVSPQLSSLITEFQQLVQNMNNLAKNSCAIAQLVVDGAVGGLKSMFVDNEKAAATQAQDGSESDMFSGLFDMAHTALSNANAATGCGGNADNYNWAQKVFCSPSMTQLPDRGNPIAKAFQMNALEQSLAAYSNSQKYVYEGMLLDIIQSMFTFSVKDPNQGSTGVGHFPRSLTLNDVVNGGGPNSAYPNATFRVTECLGNTSDKDGNAIPCTALQKFDWGLGQGKAGGGASVLGVPGYVNTMIFGDPRGAMGANAIAAMKDPAKSLIGFVSAPANSNQKMTAAQEDFVGGIALPVLSLLKQANGSPEALQSVGTYVSEYVQDYLRPRYARLFVDLAGSTFSGLAIQRAEKPVKFDDELAGYQRDLGEMEQKARRGAEALEKLNQATKIIFKNMPALTRTQKFNQMQ